MNVNLTFALWVYDLFSLAPLIMFITSYPNFKNPVTHFASILLAPAHMHFKMVGLTYPIGYYRVHLELKDNQLHLRDFQHTPTQAQTDTQTNTLDL